MNSSPPPFPQLTEREREVAGLVGLGLTNRQIADRLIVSHATISSHVRHIMAKLDVNRRSQIAALVAARESAQRASGELPVAPARTSAPEPSRFDPRVLYGILALVLAIAATSALRTRLAQHAPSPGPLMFDLSQPDAAARLHSMVRVENDSDSIPVAFVPSADASVQFRPDGVHMNPTDAYTLVALTDVPLADLTADINVRQLSGDSSYVLQLRGCLSASTDFYALTIRPLTGELEITRTRCKLGTVQAVLLATAKRLRPVPLQQDEPLRVVVQGAHVRVYEGGQLAAEAADSAGPLPAGGIRVAAFPGASMLLSALAVYGPE